MKITSIHTSHYNKPVNFTGKMLHRREDGSWESREYKSEEKRQADTELNLRASLLAIPLGFGLLIYGLNGCNKKAERDEEFLEKTEQIINSDNIKTDTFMVKDINNDKIPVCRLGILAQQIKISKSNLIID